MKIKSQILLFFIRIQLNNNNNNNNNNKMMNQYIVISKRKYSFEFKYQAR